MSHRFVDLQELVRHLGRHGPYRDLPRMLDQAVRAQSCQADLRQAEAALAALDRLMASPRAKGSLERNATEAALLMSAIILYVRATSTSSGKGERGSVSVQAKLGGDLQKDHAVLVRLRNRALAHVYLYDAADEDLVWHENRPFLEADDGETAWHVGVGSRSTQLHGGTIERLRRVLPPALEVVRARFRKRIDAVSEVINQHPVGTDLLERFMISPERLFGSVDAAEVALKGRTAGEAWFFSLDR